MSKFDTIKDAALHWVNCFNQFQQDMSHVFIMDEAIKLGFYRSKIGVRKRIVCDSGGQIGGQMLGTEQYLHLCKEKIPRKQRVYEGFSGADKRT